MNVEMHRGAREISFCRLKDVAELTNSRTMSMISVSRSRKCNVIVVG